MPTTTARVSLFTQLAIAGATITLAAVVGCSMTSDDATSDGATSEASTSEPSTTVVEDVVVEADDFKPLAQMTLVREFFVDNVAGDLDATLDVANDPEGGTYPVGTVIQLIPQEAMVKRAPGFDPDSNDWEFFTLDPTAAGTTIVSRGGSEVKNGFTGQSCAECHRAADAQFDFVCEDDHGCEPLPVSDDVITAIQASDPRT